ncbi:Sphingosine N-acyltransferase lag1 [Yamadazyma tenuis]|uniref:Longevity-assurance protein 1 n=1 Tax=Candida tenuis (strain ATCC 10573 / BCRC 21748 / CBS 615 / JCM 9827 / NBRC 10315 / NRRL Y-1498 / VKM Y-70) TaxID=590646 RepID=G3B6U2_CANTC|nr:longevity-assurance protein 1 [Yamadazyma tenuis ATCC 10573]EGV63020.1 longevity-assurance protein 1 [Yamadazyma tenuis ATCC 10573]WEJ97161.1 Sphingosine N-acyltransferase lag1 [Yamadazyma tenuis]
MTERTLLKQTDTDTTDTLKPSTPKPNPSSKSSDGTRYENSFVAFIERNSFPFSRTVLFLLYSLHIFSKNSTVHTWTSKLVTLSNQTGIDANGYPVYDICNDDAFVVLHGVLLFMFIRSFLMIYVFAPFASYTFRMDKRAKVRFAEQSWSCFYASFSTIYGMYLYYNSEYWGHLENLFAGWPHDKMSTSFKAYYLMQIAFWLSQIIVLNIEEKRKDHYQMFGHHIITSLLCIGSYQNYYMRIGNLILILMDFCDVCLTGAKVLKYAGFSTLCDIMFVCFLLSWVILRHGVYNYLFYYAMANAESLMTLHRCVPGVVEEKCWSRFVLYTCFVLLAILQLLCIAWLYSISKVAYRVVSGTGAEDVRSDSDDSDDELEDEQQSNEQQLAENKKN